MATEDHATLGDLLRVRPVQFLLCTVLPLALAGMQLLNSLVYDLSVLVSVPFAVVMVAFATVLTQYQLVRVRMTRLGATGWPATAD
jgi:hypothetical protein